MLMVAKKSVRILSVQDTGDIVNEGEIPVYSSQNKCGKQIHESNLEESKLKENNGSNVTSRRKLGVQSSSRKGGIGREYHERDCVEGEICYKGHVGLRGNIPRSCERDVQAALTLMQLSNDISGLLKMQPSSSRGSCPIQKFQKRRKFDNSSTLAQLVSTNNDVDEENDQLKREMKLGTKGLSVLKMRKKKSVDRTYVSRQAELDYNCIKTEAVLDEKELPISSLKRRGLPKSSLEKTSLKKLKAEPELYEGPASRFSVSEGANITAPESRPLEKLQLDSICSSDKSFSFSILHFLSAIRIAMVTPYTKDDALASSKYPAKSNPDSIDHYPENKVISNSQGEQTNLPCLSMDQIIERVRRNPGDPRILEGREPLQDLIRGALKIFSSITAPLGAKGSKALTLYSKPNKSWSWIGPVANKPHNHMKEVISSDAWGLPHFTLQKLVNSFADWLKVSQESLQKIGDLPAPPLTLMHQTLSVKERLREVRPRKTVATIGGCPEEIRDYFRKEEAVRYVVPERAFLYTALDGRKSTVAPLRRCSGKPSVKCREHFMLKADRPPNITVLSLVRDAAARLPAGIGTRADICVLLRASQYITEDISEEQLNQVVSGALDRLHYEHDPCVQFDGESRFWFYLHGDRDEDDFESEATSSTRRRRRQQEIR